MIEILEWLFFGCIIIRIVIGLMLWFEEEEG